MENLEKLIVDLKDSLERELAGLRHDVQQGFAQLNARFDTQAARLEHYQLGGSPDPPSLFRLS